jgi:hypothetical protein
MLKKEVEFMQDANRTRSFISRALHLAVRAAAPGVAMLLLLQPFTTARPASADTSYTDLTSTRLLTNWSYPDKGTGQTDTQSTLFLLGLPISQSQKNTLTPLSLLPLVQLGPAFDQIWSQTPDSDGKIALDKACGIAQQQVTQQVNQGSYHAYNTTCSFTQTGGSVGAQIQTSWSGPENPQTLQPTTITGDRLELDYLVHNNSVTFDVTSPYTGGVSPLSDAKFTANFDLMLTVYLVTSDSTCSMKPTLEATISNFSIAGDNAEAQFAMSNIPDVQSLIGVANSVMNQKTIPAPSSLTNQLGPLTQVWGVACSLGFPQVSATLDPAKGLAVQFTHPLAGAPLTFGQVGNLFGATIAADQSDQVNAGAPIAIDGNYFTYYAPNSSSSTALTFSWTDIMPASQLVLSDVSWGPQGGKTQTVPISRTPNDNKDTYQATGLSGNAPYQFQVRDCDIVTCSQWSDWQTWTTGALGSNTVQFWLDGDASNKIGTATVGQDGTFTTQVTIPSGTSAGPHTLNALAASSGGQPATTSVTVLAVGATHRPEIELLDSTTGHPVPAGSRYIGGNPFTLSGSNFGAGKSIAIYLDKSGGQSVGTAQAAGDGTFQVQLTMPTPDSGGWGNHKIVAVESGGGSNGQASVAVDIEAPPQ